MKKEIYFYYLKIVKQIENNKLKINNWYANIANVKFIHN